MLFTDLCGTTIWHNSHYVECECHSITVIPAPNPSVSEHILNIRLNSNLTKCHTEAQSNFYGKTLKRREKMWMHNDTYILYTYVCLYNSTFIDADNDSTALMHWFKSTGWYSVISLRAVGKLRNSIKYSVYFLFN